MKRVSRSFSLSTIQEGISYSIVWTDVNGTTTTIPCYSDGVAKTVPEGAETNPWLTAMLYKAEGSSAPEPCEAKTVIMKVYDVNGNPIYTYPTKGDSSFFSIEKQNYDHASEAKYEVEFLNANSETLAKSAICRTLDGTNGTNGSSAPYYDVYQYAWNNSTDTHPDSGWSDTIPSQGSNAYLWIKTTRWNWNSATSQYVEGATSYGRMTGERGTSIQVKGHAIAVIYDVYIYMQDLPSSAPRGSYAFVRYDQNNKHLWQYLPTGWEANDYTFKTNDIVLKLGDSQPWKFTAGEQGTLDHITAATDGDAYSVKMDGHLWQWNLEALNWLDLGQFKGEKGDDGTTYYTHVAWATNVYEADGNIYVVGFVTSKAYDDTTHKWMGVLVDTNPNHDSRHPEHYTWSLTKGVQGDRGKIGRFYYYGGVFDPNDSTTKFRVNDSEIPFFQDPDIDPNVNRKEYYVYNPTTNPDNNELTMAQMWSNSSRSFNHAPWEAIFNDFKYIITEAIFSDYAHLGSFIINGDWMISQQGQNHSPNPKTPSYLDFTPLNNGTFDNNRFVPTFAINAQTGETWHGNAHVNGEINATSGTFNGRIVSSSGSIGGFNISSNSLENNEAIDGSKIQLKSTNSLASIGNVKMPNDINDVLFGARIASEFTANEIDSLNVAVKARATGSGGARNFALHGFGHVVTQGMAVGYKLNVMNITSSYKYIDIKEGNIVLISGGNNRIAYLPTLSNVRNELKIPKTEPFAVKLTLLIASDDMHIYGYQSGATYQSDNYPPYQRDNYFTNHPNHDVSKGQVYTYMLVWDGTDDPQHYNAWLVGYGDRGY